MQRNLCCKDLMYGKWQSRNLRNVYTRAEYSLSRYGCSCGFTFPAFSSLPPYYLVLPPH
jgi:hypothetical protein